jgi:hypothetical protein
MKHHRANHRHRETIAIIELVEALQATHRSFKC